MTLDRLTQITESGIKSGITLTDTNLVGVITASSLTVNGPANISGQVTASEFSGNVTGNLTGNVNSVGVSTFSGGIQGNLTGNVTGNVNSVGVSTVTTLNATNIVGVNTLGVTTAYVGSIISRFSDTRIVEIRSSDGSIELVRGGDGGFGPYIDFKNSNSEDFDCRIQQVNDGFRFSTGAVNDTFIDSSGRFIVANQPAIDLNGNNPAAVNWSAGAGVLTSGQYSQTFSNGGMSWNGTNGRVTVPVTGNYLVNFIVYIQTGSANGNGRFQIRKNGSNYLILQTGNGLDGTCVGPSLINLNANDYVDIITDGFDLPGTFQGAQHTRFFMYLLG